MNAADQEEVIMIKGKRTKRPRPSSPLELTMAATSSSTAAAAGGDVVMSDGVSDRTNPSLSDSGELTHDDEEEDMAHCLILLAKGQRQRMMSPQPPAAAGEVYQCKTCSKSFSSFQALGGHRASHKKPSNKPPLLTLGDQKVIKQEYSQSRPRSTILSLQIANKITRVHECSLCGAEFASGQALGGHMRRHRPIPVAAAAVNSSSHGYQDVKRERNMMLSLDLNMPAPEDDQPAESKFAFAPQEQVIVFSATPLIDCHY